MRSKKLRGQHSKLKAEVRRIHKEHQKSYSLQRKLDAEVRDLAIAILLEEKILARVPWELDVDKFVLQNHDGNFPSLKKLLEYDWHCDFGLVKTWMGVNKSGDETQFDVYLRFDDGEMRIDFQSYEDKCLEFIKEHGLKVTIPHAEDKIKELEDKLVAMRGIKKRFKSCLTVKKIRR